MVIVSLLLNLLLPPALAGHSEARTCVNNKVLDSYKNNWRLRTADSFNISEGDTRYFLVTLASTIEYQFVACADDVMQDMAIVIYNDSGRIVGESDVVSREVTMDFAPPKSSQYFVGVRALNLVGDEEEEDGKRRRKGAEPSAGVGLAVLYK
jgi:hypothetical protein